MLTLKVLALQIELEAGAEQSFETRLTVLPDRQMEAGVAMAVQQVGVGAVLYQQTSNLGLLSDHRQMKCRLKTNITVN